MQAYYPTQKSSGGLLAMIALLVVALIGVIVYFMVFADKGYRNIFTGSSDYLVDKTMYNFTIDNFSKNLTVTISGDTYTFTDEESKAYNFDLKTPPKSYEIETISGNMFFIKNSEKDEYLQYKGSSFSMVSSKTVFESNENISLSSFTLSNITPPPTYDDIVSGPTGFVRDGAVLKTMTGTLDDCKAECSSNSMCIGFNYNTADNSCELKTLSGTFEKGLSDYVSNVTAQYYYKKDTLGFSNTYTGSVTGFALDAGTWNTDLTFDDCLQEAKSASSSGVVGVGYDITNKTCYFSDGSTTDDIVLEDPQDPTKMMMCLGTRDIKQGCKS